MQQPFTLQGNERDTIKGQGEEDSIFKFFQYCVNVYTAILSPAFT